MPKYFIYARKSMESEERQQLSIPAQLDELRDFAKKNNLQVIDSLIESQTAKKPGRKVFNELMNRIQSGEADGILSWHADRLARNAVDAGQIIHLLDTGQLTDLKFPTVDFQNNPSGKFMLSIAFATSKNYVDNLAVNTKRGLVAKARRGTFPGLAPLGYRNSRIDGRKTITVSKKWAPVVIRLFQKYASGKYTLIDLSSYLFEQGWQTQPNKRDPGGQPMRSDRLRKTILQNPFYYGLFKYAGEYYEGKHKALIGKSLFDKVQEQIEKRNGPWIRANQRGYFPFTFSRLIKCGECGQSITQTIKTKHYKNGGRQDFRYYHCTKTSKIHQCRQSYMPKELAVKDLFEICKDVSLPEKSGQWLLDRLSEDEQSAAGHLGQAKAKLNAKLDETAAKLNQLLNLYLDMTISREEYLAKKNELTDQRKTIEERLLHIAEFQNDNIEKAKDFVRLTIQAGKISRKYQKIAENEGEDKTGIEPGQPPLTTQEPSQISALTPALADWLKKAELNLFLKDRKVYHIKQKPWAALRAAATGRNLVSGRGIEPPRITPQTPKACASTSFATLT